MDGPIPPEFEAQPHPETPTPIPSPPKKANYIFGCLGIALGLFLAILRAWAWSYGMMNTEAWGFAWGAAILPALIAYAIAGRKSVRNFNRFGIWFSGLSLLFFMAYRGTPVSLEHHIGSLMKEAAGTRPINNSGPETLDNLIRDMMRGILDDRKAFERETEPFTPELGKLYTAETFSSREAMQRSIDAVHGVVAADQRYSKRLETITDRMQSSVDGSSFSESDKRDFMEGVRKSVGNAKALQIRRRAMETESQWEGATVALYEFAIANASKIRAEGTHLIISDEGVRGKFNDQFHKAQKLRDYLSELNAQLESAQRAALQEAGVTPKDLGIVGNDPVEKK